MMFCILHEMRQKLNKIFFLCSSFERLLLLFMAKNCVWKRTQQRRSNNRKRRQIEKESNEGDEKRWFYGWCCCCCSNHIDCAKVLSRRTIEKKKKKGRRIITNSYSSRKLRYLHFGFMTRTPTQSCFSQPFFFVWPCCKCKITTNLI